MRPELQDIVDEAARVLSADVTLEDRGFNLVAYATQRFDLDAVRTSSILQRRSPRSIQDWFEQFGITASASPMRTPSDDDRGVRSRLCFPVRWRGVTYGYLWALDDVTLLDQPAVARVAELADHAGSYLAHLSRQHQEDAFAVSDLVAADVEKARDAAARLAERGRMARPGPVVAVLVTAAGAVLPAGQAPNLWSLPRSVLAHRLSEGIVLAVPLRSAGDDQSAQEAAALTIGLLHDDLPLGWAGRVVAGIGEPQVDIEQLRISWLEARLAAKVAAAVPALGPVARWADLGLYRLLATLSTSELAPLVLDAAVRRLLDTADAELIDTVRLYLDRAGSVQATAADLHIHRQTLYYRLSKAEALTGLSFVSGQDRARLQLGLMLAPLLS
ncbi:MAG: PucR family transcriptional regulator [Friedmanniella sp.]